MAARMAAQSVPRPFTGVIAPELPHGSPERAELFRRFRLSFSEDWKAAEEAVACRRLAKGDLYFIRAGECVKIGRTVHVGNRLAKMQADNHEDLDCLVVLRGRGHEEREWHDRFRGDHIRGEWFRWSPAIEAAVRDAQEANRRATPVSLSRDWSRVHCEGDRQKAVDLPTRKAWGWS